MEALRNFVISNVLLPLWEQAQASLLEAGKSREKKQEASANSQATSNKSHQDDPQLPTDKEQSPTGSQRTCPHKQPTQAHEETQMFIDFKPFSFEMVCYTAISIWYSYQVNAVSGRLFLSVQLRISNFLCPKRFCGRKETRRTCLRSLIWLAPEPELKWVPFNSKSISLCPSLHAA